MKKLLSTLIIGLILLYLIDSAFQIDGLKPEMLMDNLVRFFLGFMLIGIWGLAKHRLKLKIFMYIIFIFLISDGIFDYIQNVSTLDMEMILHDLYIFVWGAVSGLFFVKYLQCKKIIPE
jgi:hypothetical protein